MQTVSAWRKSSYSGNGGQNCVEVGAWRTSTYSSGNGGQCVEVAGAGTVLVRDTVNHEGAMLSVTADAWSAFLGTLK